MPHHLIEVCDGLHTRPTPVTELEDNVYVLLSEDIDTSPDEIALLIDADYDEPVLWRFVGLDYEIKPGHLLAYFDGPDDVGPESMFVLEVQHGAMVRLILPGEEHDRWSVTA